VGLLLKDGAQPSWTNYEEKPPLLLAALNGHTHIVSILRSHNKPSELEEALCDAAGASHAGVVEHLLQVGISTNSSKTQHQHRLVVGKDHKAIVRLLLNANESHSCPDHAPNDFIPLHHAVRLGQVDIAALLLDYGLNIQTRDALKRTVLFETLSTPDLSDVNLLLVHEINIFVCNYMGNFVLHQTARRGFVKHASLFLDQGIKSNVWNAGGMTPLHLATKCGRYEVADLLVRKNAAVDVCGKAD